MINFIKDKTDCMICPYSCEVCQDNNYEEPF